MNITRLTRVTSAALALLLVTAGFAEAHPGLPGHSHGFFDGVAHPLSGLDHIAAMVAVGLWAASLGGRALWAVPCAFVALLGIGAVLGVAGVAVPWVEAAITASVVVLGLLVALNVRLPTVPAAALVGLFAVFHGVSHGAEMPAMADPLAYGLGFLLATAALHASGIGLGVGLSRLGGPVLSRAAGALTVGAGVVLAFAG